MKKTQLFVFATLLPLALLACQSSDAAEVSQDPVVPSLEDSRWILEKFVSNSDAQGVQYPAESQIYQVYFEPGGIARFRLNCNLAMANWENSDSSEATQGKRGSLTFGPMAATLAFCAPPSMDEQFLRDSADIVSYVIQGQRLYMNLKIDGGDYVWLYQGKGILQEIPTPNEREVGPDRSHAKLVAVR